MTVGGAVDCDSFGGNLIKFSRELSVLRQIL